VGQCENELSVTLREKTQAAVHLNYACAVARQKPLPIAVYPPRFFKVLLHVYQRGGHTSEIALPHISTYIMAT
jgi:hypothetical protein